MFLVFCIDFGDRVKERERERETLIGYLLYVPHQGIKPTA